ncbi:unnamed protein product [Trichogramma brassicae]|uniref:Mothers against decapentaplegic homolog n=1 Tax=Trichogramma brassicae TaxID=86971 RepID=A0A6H5IPZ1_9HYME|nr:unnamed protein product [Trichogramma brassicae]
MRQNPAQCPPSEVSSPSPSLPLKRLLGWKQVGEDDKWAEGKPKKGDYEELMRAISNPGAPTRCVTIPRSVDGLWRWPDIQSHHELKPLEICQFPFSSSQEEVCINPYHYKRVGNAKLPPVLVPTVSGYAPGREPVQYYVEQQSEDLMPPNVTYNPTRGKYLVSRAEVLGVDRCYYELNSRVGEAFQCEHKSIVVDGYTDPRKDTARFCLGQLSNDCVLNYAANALFVENYSEMSIFVQSRNCNYERGFNISTVIKVPSGCSIKIFDNALFANLLGGPNPRGLRVSFLILRMGSKLSPSDVTSTPCWIEMHLNGP